MADLHLVANKLPMDCTFYIENTFMGLDSENKLVFHGVQTHFACFRLASFIQKDTGHFSVPTTHPPLL